MVIRKLSLFLILLVVSAAKAGAADVIEVSVAKMQYDPPHVKIKPGTTVRWVNREKRSNHSIVFEEEGLPEADRMFPGESWQRIFDKPGVYRYHCGPHPEMTGVVEVAD